jgi:hypothetical protein
MVIFIACKKNENHGGHPLGSSQGYNGPSNIAGHVTQFNQYGEVDVAPLNNVVVTLSTGSGTVATTTTDINGNYKLENIQSNLYTISFSKLGCGTWRMLEATINGSNTITYNGYTTEKPNYTFLSFNIKDSSQYPGAQPQMWVTGTMNPINKPTGFLVIGVQDYTPDITNPSYCKYLELFTVAANSSTFGVLGSNQFPHNTTYNFKIFSHAPTASLAALKYDAVNSWTVPSYGVVYPDTFTVMVP